MFSIWSLYISLSLGFSVYYWKYWLCRLKWPWAKQPICGGWGVIHTCSSIIKIFFISSLWPWGLLTVWSVCVLSSLGSWDNLPYHLETLSGITCLIIWRTSLGSWDNLTYHLETLVSPSLFNEDRMDRTPIGKAILSAFPFIQTGCVSILSRERNTGIHKSYHSLIAVNTHKVILLWTHWTCWREKMTGPD